MSPTAVQPLAQKTAQAHTIRPVGDHKRYVRNEIPHCRSLSFLLCRALDLVRRARNAELEVAGELEIRQDVLGRRRIEGRIEAVVVGVAVVVKGGSLGAPSCEAAWLAHETA